MHWHKLAKRGPTCKHASAAAKVSAASAQCRTCHSNRAFVTELKNYCVSACWNRFLLTDVDFWTYLKVISRLLHPPATSLCTGGLTRSWMVPDAAKKAALPIFQDVWATLKSPHPLLHSAKALKTEQSLELCCKFIRLHKWGMWPLHNSSGILESHTHCQGVCHLTCGLPGFWCSPLAACSHTVYLMRMGITSVRILSYLSHGCPRTSWPLKGGCF